MHKRFAIVFIASFIIISIAGSAMAQTFIAPATPNASPEARALLRALNRIAGRAETITEIGVVHDPGGNGQGDQAGGDAEVV